MSNRDISRFIVTSRQIKMGAASQRGGLSELRQTSEESQGAGKK